jgi:hypothetical protein
MGVTTVDRQTYPNATRVYGRLVLTTGNQGAGAPIIDSCHITAVDGWHCAGWAIRLKRTHGRAFIIGWKTSTGASQLATYRRLHALPLVGRLFKARY